MNIQITQLLLGVVVTVSSLLTTIAAAQTVTTHTADLNNITVHIHIEPEDFEIRQLNAQESLSGVYFHRPSARNQAGEPALPVIRLLIAVGDSNYTVSGHSMGSALSSIPGVVLAEEPEKLVEGESAVIRAVSERFAHHGRQTITLKDKVRLGHLAIIPVEVRPFYYDLNAQKLMLKNDVVFTLNASRFVERYDFAGLVNELDRFQIQQLVANGNDAIQRLPAAQAVDGSFMIVTQRSFEEAAEQLRSHHAAAGRESFIHYLESTGVSPAQLARIVKEAHQRASVKTLLLLGDESIIPMASLNSTLGDTKYALLDGDGYLDIAVGRLPAATPAEALHFVRKSIHYQTLVAGGYENKRAVLSAHKEEYPGKYTANMERVRKGPNRRELEFVTVYGGNGGQNQDIVQLINDGVGLVNYRGHGSYEAWSSWASDGSFSKRDISSLTNTGEDMTVVLNIACNNGGIQKNYPVLVEDLLNYKVGGEELSGVVATLGATRPSYTTVNHDFAEYIFQFIGELTEPQLGAIHVLSNNALTRDRNGVMNKNTKMYVLFADPNLRLAVGE